MQHKEFRANKPSKNVKSLVQQARDLTKKQRYSEALTTYEEVLKENPEAAGAYMGIGSIHLRQGALDKAEEYFNGALHVTKKTAPVLAMLANVAQKRDDMSKALRLFQEALASDPKFMKAALGVGKILFRSERYDEAERVISHALKYNPNSNEAEILLSRIMQKQGQSEEAIENLSNLLVRDPTSWSANFLKAQTYLRHQEYALAIESAKRCLRIKPDHIRAAVCLAQALIATKQYIKAIDILEGLIAQNPDTWSTKMLLARAYLYNGDLDEAKALLSKMAHGRRGLGPVHFLLGDVFEAQGLLSHAVTEYEAAVLHSDKLVERYPQIRELVEKHMPVEDKAAEFKKIIAQFRESNFDESQDNDEA